MANLTQEQIAKFKEATIRCAISHRGGGLEISLDSFGFNGERMSAYQNYLGGGMLDRVVSDCTLWRKKARYNAKRLSQVSEQLKMYFFYLTNPESEDDEVCWEAQTYEQNQQMPVSGY